MKDFNSLVNRYGCKDFIVNITNMTTLKVEIVENVKGIFIPKKSKRLNVYGEVDEFSATFLTSNRLESDGNKLELIYQDNKYIMTVEYEHFANETSNGVAKLNHSCYRLAIIGKV